MPQIAHINSVIRNNNVMETRTTTIMEPNINATHAMLADIYFDWYKMRGYDIDNDMTEDELREECWNDVINPVHHPYDIAMVINAVKKWREGGRNG